jgi:beta-glucanase (GH16 family)
LDLWRLTGEALGSNGNVGQRVIPEVPMSIIMNFGMSPGFSALHLTGLASLMPTTMRFGYVRIYWEFLGRECSQQSNKALF